MSSIQSLGSILVVDDSADNLAIECTILRKAGFDPRPADSGPRALELAAADLPDLVLLDVSMPGMDGYETCTRLKADKATSAVPVIFLTAAEVSPEAVLHGFDVGAVDYITKPVVEKILVARVGVQCRLGKIAADLAGRSRELAAEIEARDRMLYVLSHDLKNSFFVAQSGAELLQNEWSEMDEATRLSFIAAIGESAGRSIRLLLQILDWTKIEIGKHDVATSIVDTSGLLVDVVLGIGTEAQKKGLTVVQELGIEIPPVTTDPYAVSAILRNLATNACKFTPSGGIVRLGIRRLGASVEFYVEDTGPGLDPTQAAGLTGAHVKSTPGTAGERGSGLGLLICGLLATRIGTEIHVGRIDGKTTRISFQLPLPPA